MNAQFYPEDNERRSYTSGKRKLSDYDDDDTSSKPILDRMSASFDYVNGDESDEDDVEDEDEDEDEDGSSGDDEVMSDDESNHENLRTTSSPCTIIQRRHSDTIQSSYCTPIVKRRCTYSSMHDDEQKRSVLVESYRKLRGVKKPKLQVSLLICNLIKRLEKTFTKTPPLRQQEQEHVQYYQSHRTTYRSSSSDSLYMSPLSSTLVNDEIETTNQQYSSSSSSPSSTYDSDKVLLSVNDLRTSSAMYHPSTTDAYWLAQSNFAVPVVSTSDDDVDVSLHGGGDYLDLSDNTLSSSFSSSSISNDCCCSSTSSTTMTKHLVDTNNNTHTNDDYFIYHHHHHHHSSSSNGQTFFYPHNGTNTVDIITTA